MSKVRRKLKKEVRYVIGFVAVVLVLLGFIVWYRQSHEWNFASELDSIILSVGDTNMNLRELTYYIMSVEEAGDRYAKMYDADNPRKYWNLYMNNELTQSGYVSELARAAAMDYCIRDNIYALEAMSHGIYLTDEEEAEVIYDATNAYETMTLKARTTTRLTAEDFKIIMLKEALAHKYIAMLCQQDEDGVLDAIVLKYDVGGSYYESLKASYDIWVDEESWNHVKVGTITIN